jgi:hypothetical protein
MLSCVSAVIVAAYVKSKSHYSSLARLASEGFTKAIKNLPANHAAYWKKY